MGEGIEVERMVDGEEKEAYQVLVGGRHRLDVRERAVGARRGSRGSW